MRKRLWWFVPVALVRVLFGALVPVLFPRPCPVTRAAFDRIEVGMTKTEVEKILGGPEGDYTTMPIDPPPWLDMREEGKQIVLVWEGDEGSVTVFFDGSEMVTRKEFTEWNTVNIGPLQHLQWRFDRWRERTFGTDP